MPIVIVLGVASIILWAVFSRRLERWGLSGPVVLTVLGGAIASFDPLFLAHLVDSPAVEKIVELILSVILFVDATEVSGGLFGREGRVTARLVFIGLPLALILAVVAGILILPGFDILMFVVVACIVMPTDFAAAAPLLRTPLIPQRLRSIVNVESGYNDGLIAPVFGVFLGLAVALPQLVEHVASGRPDSELSHETIDRLGEVVFDVLNAVPATAVAIGIGVALGWLSGLAVRWATDRRLTTESSVRFVMLLVPLLAYGLATLPDLSANGFVAAFAAGPLYRIMRTRKSPDHVVPHGELVFVEGVGVLASQVIWFLLGGLVTYAVAQGIDWRLVLFAVLALTVLRMIPVYVSLLGSRIRPRDRLVIGALGPRGTASIVFALLAYAALRDDNADLALLAGVITVGASLILHGFVAPLVLPWISARRHREPVAIDE